MKRLLTMITVMTMLCVASPVANAETETVYGRDLMTEQERREERQMMRTMTAEERQQYRIEKHERMKERAKAQGKSIPDEPGVRGKGMGQGGGMGQGMGRGSGMGGGRGR